MKSQYTCIQPTNNNNVLIVIHKKKVGKKKITTTTNNKLQLSYTHTCMYELVVDRSLKTRFAAGCNLVCYTDS